MTNDDRETERFAADIAEWLHAACVQSLSGQTPEDVRRILVREFMHLVPESDADRLRFDFDPDDLKSGLLNVRIFDRSLDRYLTSDEWFSLCGVPVAEKQLYEIEYQVH